MQRRNQAVSHRPNSPLRGNFVMLRAGSLRLLLRKEEVGAARYLGVRPEPSGEPGLFRLGDDPAGHYLAAC